METSKFFSKSQPFPEGFIFVVLLGIYLIPIWSITPFLTQDGPSHLYNSVMMSRSLTGEEMALTRIFYRLNHALEPNFVSHVIMSVLGSFLPLWLVEKVMQSLVILIPALGVRALVLSINPRAGFLSLLALPFLYAFPLVMGFYNYLLGIGLLFFFLALWNRYQADNRPGIMLLLGLLALVIYFSHLSAILLLYGALAFFYVGGYFRDNRKDLPRETVMARLLHRLFRMILIIMPSLVLTIGYLIRSGSRIEFDGYRISMIGDRFLEFFKLSSLVLTTPSEWYFNFLLIAALMGLLVFGGVKKLRDRIRQNDLLLAMAGVLGLAYLFIPETVMGGSMLEGRIQYLPFLFLISWLAQFHFGKQAKIGVLVLIVVITAGHLFLRYPQFKTWSQKAQSYLELGPEIVEESILLPIFLENPSVQVVDKQAFTPTLHLSNYLAAQYRVLSLSNYEARVGYFPLRWEPSLRPEAFFPLDFRFFPVPQEGKPEPYLPDAYNDILQREEGLEIDYVLVYGDLKAYRQIATAQDLFEHLDKKGRFIAVNSDKTAWLYELQKTE